MDLIAILCLIAVCALAAGFASGNVIVYLREEWRLMRSYEWTCDEPTEPTPQQRTEKLIERMEEARARMRRERIPYLLTDGKPEWRTGKTRPTRPASITPIRRAK